MRSLLRFDGRPLLDIASYARRGPAERVLLSPEETAHIGRTLRRHPEVMVKVLAQGGRDLHSVARHLAYIGRQGELTLESDEGEAVGARDTKKIVESWDLELEEDRPASTLDVSGSARKPRLVHKVIFSMPAGTPPDAMFVAVRNFAREEFSLKHRYVLALHTDEPHPHVHMVIKAVSEQGERLHIRKPTLRRWRFEFARHLRVQGIAANATERIIRGELRNPMPDGLYRAMERGAPLQRRPEDPTRRLRRIAEGSKPSQYAVMNGWLVLADALGRSGHDDLAYRAVRFSEAPLRQRPLFASGNAREVNPWKETHERVREARERDPPART